MRGLIGIFLIFGFTLSVDAKIKNLYILVEPSAVVDVSMANKHILTPLFMNMDRVLQWVSGDGIHTKFHNVYIRVIGDIAEPYKRSKVGKMGKQGIFKIIYNRIKNTQAYSTANGLSRFSQDLEGQKWRGDETMLLIVGDMDFVQNGISSHAKYLNGAWLTRKESPFKRSFLDRDNSVAKGTSVVVFNRTQLALKDEKQREQFIINLFDKAGMSVYYVGDFYNHFIAPLHYEDSFMLKLIDRVRKREHTALKAKTLPQTHLCQIISDEAMTIKNCGR